jgi:6-phosphogluconolactonase (cycloisomerase 2 family)
MTSARLLRPSVALVVLLSLAACGGGGGGDNNTPAPNPPAPNPPTPNPPGPPASRTIGGAVTGLNGAGLVLQNNGGDNLAINADGTFTFATSVAQGNAYNVTVATQPSSPQQTCVVSSGSGTAGDANVTSVAVACATDTFTVTANIVGLTGAGLAIANGSDRIRSNTNGSFTFDTAVLSGGRYNVLIDAAPAEPVQRCTVTNGNGTITNADVTVTIMCAATFPTLAYNLNQADGTIASYAIDAATGQMRPRFVAKTGASPAQLTTYKTANGTRFSYIANQNSDSVSAFTLDARSGAMTEVPGSPFDSGDKPTLLSLHPTAPFLYAMNESDASIIAYTINANNGALTQVSSMATGSSPRAFSIDASGHFAYVAASGSGELFTFAIDQTAGALSEVANSRVAIGTSFGGMALERNGRFVYSFDSAAGTISAFAINANTGVPAAITGSPFTAGTNIALLDVHPNGRFIYAKRGPQTQVQANGVAVFSIDETTGALSEIAGSPFDASANPLAITFDPTGTRMYAGHLLVQGTPEFNVRAYSVNPNTGALTVIDGSPFASPAFPSSLDVDSTGTYLYVANIQSNQLTAYRIDNGDGSLAQLSSSPSNVGASPTVVTTEEDSTPLSLSSKFVYVTDPAGSVRSFSIAADGTLSAGPVPSVAANAPLGITLDPQGRFAYVADTAASAVRIYSVNASTGTLTEIDNSPVGTGGAPHYVAIEPSGRYAYVSVPGTMSIVKFAVDANTGRLSAPVTKTATDDVQDLVITPNGRWLMATSVGGSTVYSYTINANDGELGTEVALDLGATVAITSIALDLSGRFAYITNTTNGDGELRQFQINAQTGALSPVGFPFGYDAIGVPKGIAVDPKGSFMYSADSSGNGVSMFSINSTTGAPTYRGSTPAGTNPIAITTDYSGDFVRVAAANGELLTFRVNRDDRDLTLIDTETGGGATAEPATIVTSSHAE